MQEVLYIFMIFSIVSYGLKVPVFLIFIMVFVAQIGEVTAGQVRCRLLQAAVIVHQRGVELNVCDDCLLALDSTQLPSLSISFRTQTSSDMRGYSVVPLRADWLDMIWLVEALALMGQEPVETKPGSSRPWPKDGRSEWPGGTDACEMQYIWCSVAHPPPPPCGWVMVPPPPVVVGLWWGSACF